MAIEDKVMCAVFDKNDTMIYSGDSKESEGVDNIAKSRTYGCVRRYHRCGENICINETVYEQGNEKSHTLRYVSSEELDILMSFGI